MKRINRLIRDETGAAAILEYSLIMPMCIILLFCLFMFGYVMNQYAVLETAALRGALIAQKVYADPNYLNMVQLAEETDDKDFVGYKNRINESLSNLESDPYRYFNNNYKADTIENLIVHKVMSVINNNQFSALDNKVLDIDIEVQGMEGIIFKKMKVVVTEKFNISLLSALNVEPIFSISREATITVTQPAEMIRNSHFAWDLLYKATKGKAGDVLEEIQKFFGRITDFFNNAGED